MSKPAKKSRKVRDSKPKDPRPAGAAPGVADMEPDDEVETEVGSADDLLFPHEFVEGFNQAKGTGVVVLTLDRLTGRVEVDMRDSHLLEAWAMIGVALEQVGADEHITLPAE